MSGRALSIDIGSTWTKGALVDLDGPAPRLLARDAVPTTQADLAEGFERVHRALSRGSPDTPVRFSSSAKGGLAIAAVGLVPDLTVNVARMAAASAGGKVTASFSYRLTAAHVAAIELTRPDIVLLCGGTDGGNEGYVLHNARALAGSALGCAILYAGNASIRDEVRRILGAKDLSVADNVMPEVGRLDLEPARSEIRRMFLARIVEGRGLARVRAETRCDPKPTPLAVYELVAAIAREVPGWDHLCLVDMGGATTDVYSSTESFAGGEVRVLRGIREPRLTRTVEGDLGLRVSARSAAESCRAAIDALCGVPHEAFDAWVARVSDRPELLAASPAERAFDDALALSCLALALGRHAGTEEEAWTPQGKVLVQRGKDLGAVRRLVASGGFLARIRTADLVHRALAEAARPDASTGARPLLPARPAVLADREYVVPIAANLAADFPLQAARLVVDNLVPLEAAGQGDPA
ncbi:MAG: glutamate mutase L [Spirochaetes bacterium]|nr:glutamate mutase L [Spirochaetota bacterium]